MIGAIFLISLLSASQLSFQAGKKYSYLYSTSTNVEAVSATGESKLQTFTISCKAHFTCTSSGAPGSVFEMVADQVVLSNDLNGLAADFTQNQAATDAAFARPIIFTLTPSGDVTDVQGSTDDSDDMLHIKATIAGSIRSASSDQPSRLELDTQGVHYSHYDASEDIDSTYVSSFYTEADFVHFRDEAVDPDNIALDGESNVILTGGIVSEATHRVYVKFNPNSVSDLNNADGDGTISFLSDGYASLQLASVATVNDEAVDNAMKQRHGKKMRRVPFLDPTFYAKRAQKKPQPVKEDKMDMLDDASSSCPSGVDLCQSYSGSYFLGNTSCGVKFTASGLVGTNSGCSNPNRNYMGGAYLDADLYLLSHSYTLANAYCEYGYVNGVAQRNGIGLSVIGYSVYSQAFPAAKIFSGTKTLYSGSKVLQVGATVAVLGVPVTFSCGANIGYSGTVPYNVDLTRGSANISIVPAVSVSMFAEVAANLLLAKAGIRLTASIGQNVAGTAYLSLGQCRVGIKATTTTTPFNAELIGFAATVIPGNKEGTVPFWSWSWGGQTITIFDKYYGV